MGASINRDPKIVPNILESKIGATKMGPLTLVNSHIPFLRDPFKRDPRGFVGSLLASR